MPREVKLSHGDRLDGWGVSFYSETKAPRATDEPVVGIDFNPQANAAPRRPEDYDWRARDGVIVGRRLVASAQEGAVEGRLFYQRPVRPGETLSYEFLYEPGATMVHPALGRLAFLLEPEGVRLHWRIRSRSR